jgi:hypothetical protein
MFTKKPLPQVVFLGKTGAGKTTTINALFGLDWQTSDAVACTKIVQQSKITNGSSIMGSRDRLVVVDTPGISEDVNADHRYLPMYEEALNDASCVVWVFQADTRTYRADQQALITLREKLDDKRFILALNQIDQIFPQNWNNTLNAPSLAQADNVQQKIDDLHKRLGKIISQLKRDDIVAYSAKRGYSLDKLIATILRQ